MGFIALLKVSAFLLWWFGMLANVDGGDVGLQEALVGVVSHDVCELR